MKNTVRVMLMAAFAVMLTAPAWGIGPNAGYQHFPYYWTAMPTPTKHFRVGLDVTPWDFECYPSASINGWMFAPKVSASYGICDEDEGDIGLELNPSPGFGIYGEHRFMKGNIDVSGGGRGSYSWNSSFNAGFLELSPRVIASNTENNKPFPWQANLGLSYNLYRSSYGEGTTMGTNFGLAGGFGVPIDLKLSTHGFKLQPEFGFYWRLAEHNMTTPNFEGSIGMQLRYGW